MEYEELIKFFEKGEKIYFRKNENQEWRLVTKKEELFSIHEYIYEVKSNSINDEKINNLIDFIKSQKTTFVFDPECICDSDFDIGKEEGWNEALDEVLNYINLNFHK